MEKIVRRVREKERKRGGRLDKEEEGGKGDRRGGRGERKNGR